MCFSLFWGVLTYQSVIVAICISWTNVSFELDSRIRSTNPNASKLTIKVDYILLSSFYKREDRRWFWHVSSKTMEGHYVLRIYKNDKFLSLIKGDSCPLGHRHSKSNFQILCFLLKSYVLPNSPHTFPFARVSCNIQRR